MSIKSKLRENRYGLPAIRKLCNIFASSYHSSLSSSILDQRTMALSDDAWLSFMVTQSVNPTDYDHARIYALDAQLVAFVSKLEISCSGFNPEREALRRFELAEAMCKETNSRLLSRPVGPVRQILDEARKLIATWLDDMPSPKMLQWGSGSTSACSGAWVGHNNKIRSKLDLTFDLHAVFGNWLRELVPSFHPSVTYTTVAGEDGDEFCSFDIVKTVDFSILNTNTVIYVPKTAKTHRTIGIEPHLNGAVQRMIGQDIRRRLKRFGLDLNSQEHRQKAYARQGSIDGSIGTIDLSMASDTISTGIVDLLVPPSWARMLRVLRTPAFVHPTTGEIVSYHKHSSMGNGYTWELESMIFYALSLSVVRFLGLEGPVGVYGDDIIVPSGACDLLLELLSYCGFVPNREKTFTTGPFRESCGGDYFHGVDVRPVYLRQPSLSGLVECVSQLTARGLELDDAYSDSINYLLEVVDAGVVTPYVPVGRSGGIQTDNKLLITTRFNKSLQRLEYRYRGFKGKRKQFPNDYVTREVVLSDLETRSIREGSAQTDSARNLGRWTYRWAPFWSPVECLDRGFQVP